MEVATDSVTEIKEEPLLDINDTAVSNENLLLSDRLSKHPKRFASVDADTETYKYPLTSIYKRLKHTQVLNTSQHQWKVALTNNEAFVTNFSQDDTSTLTNIIEYSSEADEVQTNDKGYEVTFSTLLTEHNLEEYSVKLKEFNIDLDCLKYIQEVDIKDIFPQDIGARIRFRGLVKDWRANINCNAVCKHKIGNDNQGDGVVTKPAKMDERKKLRAVAAMVMQNQVLFHKNIELSLVALLQNIGIMNSVANVIMKNGIAISQFNKIRSTSKDAEIVDEDWGESLVCDLDFLKMDNDGFKEMFRLRKETFKKVFHILKRTEKKTDNKMKKLCVPLAKRMAIALFALGSSTEYRTVAALFNINYNVFENILMDFCKAVCDNMWKCVNAYPPKAEKVKRIVNGFTKLGFPQCFGAIDTCHFPVNPEKEAKKFCNDKGWHSVVLFASCDYRSKFIYTNVCSGGTASDYDIFEKSSLKRFHETQETLLKNTQTIEGVSVPVLLIGDSSFRLSHILMRPYPYISNQSTLEKTFNRRLKRCHCLIRNAFNELKVRFRRLSRGLQISPSKVTVIIYACCILHNFSKEENDEIFTFWIQDLTEIVCTQNQPTSSVSKNDENSDRAVAIRNAIANSFLNGNTDPNAVTNYNCKKVNAGGHDDKAVNEYGTEFINGTQSEGGEDSESWMKELFDV